MQPEFYVEWDDLGLGLHGAGLPRNAPLRIDFEQTCRQRGPDPLLKAIGAGATSVLDATAGWGADAAHLARAGYEVTAVEKNAVVIEMLTHARNSCCDEALKARLAIVHGDSLAYLRALEIAPDVVYLDPMYPPPTKSAASKKPLAVLRLLAGPAGDNLPLFAQAMRCATMRVVVKRPRRAAPIQPGRVGETGGKLVRFDIYQPPAK